MPQTKKTSRLIVYKGGLYEAEEQPPVAVMHRNALYVLAAPPMFGKQYTEKEPPKPRIPTSRKPEAIRRTERIYGILSNLTDEELDNRVTRAAEFMSASRSKAAGNPNPYNAMHVWSDQATMLDALSSSVAGDLERKILSIAEGATPIIERLQGDEYLAGKNENLLRAIQDMQASQLLGKLRSATKDRVIIPIKNGIVNREDTVPPGQNPIVDSGVRPSLAHILILPEPNSAGGFGDELKEVGAALTALAVNIPEVKTGLQILNKGLEEIRNFAITEGEITESQASKARKSYYEEMVAKLPIDPAEIQSREQVREEMRSKRNETETAASVLHTAAEPDMGSVGGLGLAAAQAIGGNDLIMQILQDLYNFAIKEGHITETSVSKISSEYRDRVLEALNFDPRLVKSRREVRELRKQRKLEQEQVAEG